jgi:hypothetical protein
MSARRRRAERNRRSCPSTSAAMDFERLARFLGTWCQMWELCGRSTCRRARACCGPRLSCYDRHADTIFTLLNEAPCMRQFFEATRDAEEEELARQ